MRDFPACRNGHLRLSRRVGGGIFDRERLFALAAPKALSALGAVLPARLPLRRTDRAARIARAAPSTSPFALLGKMACADFRRAPAARSRLGGVPYMRTFTRFPSRSKIYGKKFKKNSVTLLTKSTRFSTI